MARLALHCSLITLILYSTYATCSDAALVLITTPGSSGITLLNPIFIKIVCTTKLDLAYKVIIHFIKLQCELA